MAIIDLRFIANLGKLQKSKTSPPDNYFTIILREKSMSFKVKLFFADLLLEPQL